MSTTAHGHTPYYYVPAESRHPVMAAIGRIFVIPGAAASDGGHVDHTPEATSVYPLALVHVPNVV